ncbi:Cupredoxin [Lactifluus volemus]|nr:Cupredoxin [Lactifluus volemus]
MHFRSFFLLTIISGVACVIGPNGVLTIKNFDISPDGFTRSATLAEGTFPGPLLKANKGSTFSIRVNDKLEDTTMDLATSIHWHGIFQKNTNYEDGVSFVTQCPLIPHESFEYMFPTGEQAGTFWYHSHFKAQYCDGLRGPLVIYDPDDPHRSLYDIDNEDTVITLADWYHYVSTIAPAIAEFNSTLINGKGRYPGGPNVSLAVVNVQQGLRYRFRLVSISCDPNYFFSIDSHNMTVIEADGNNVQPLVVDSIQIFAGQRYSFVLHAGLSIDNYWIRALPNASGIAGQNYTGLTTLLSFIIMGHRIRPLVPTPVPGKPFVGGADININLNATRNATTANFSVNGVTFDLPTVPVLLQILSGAQKASDLVPKGSIYGLARNMSVELTIPAGAAGGPVSSECNRTVIVILMRAVIY